MNEIELRALGWRTIWGIVTTFLAIPVPLFILDLDSPQFERFAAYVGTMALFIAWVAICTQISKRFWKL